MKITEYVPFASLTTLKVGGTARYVATCEHVEDIKTAIMFARDGGLSWYVLGGGSNLLASDEGFEGLIIRLVSSNEAEDISFEEQGNEVLVTAYAGVGWDLFVESCVQHGWWGIENLAGIPGTVGAAPVQNIGAYGVEVADTLVWMDVLDTNSLEVRRMEKYKCEFSYRDSIFKRDRSLIIIRVAFSLISNGSARATYADIDARVQQGAIVDTPQAVALLVRLIRSEKFPDLNQCGTAGSFFKNPVIDTQTYTQLKEKYPELPGYESTNGTKVSLAWILDKALHLKGYSKGPVRLFEKQPLVLVTESTATANDVDTFAKEVAQKVFEATNISIEREVQNIK